MLQNQQQSLELSGQCHLAQDSLRRPQWPSSEPRAPPLLYGAIHVLTWESRRQGEEQSFCLDAVHDWSLCCSPSATIVAVDMALLDQRASSYLAQQKSVWNARLTSSCCSRSMVVQNKVGQVCKGAYAAKPQVTFVRASGVLHRLYKSDHPQPWSMMASVADVGYSLPPGTEVPLQQVQRSPWAEPEARCRSNASLTSCSKCPESLEAVPSTPIPTFTLVSSSFLTGAIPA